MDLPYVIVVGYTEKDVYRYPTKICPKDETLASR